MLRRRKQDQGSSRQRRFEEVVLPQLDVLYRIALRLTANHQEAEDLVQETCLRAFRSIDRFDGQHDRAWLLTILRHLHVSRWRHDGRIGQAVPYDEEEPDEPGTAQFPMEQSAEDAVLVNVLPEDLDRALTSLSEESRMMLLLAYVEELSYAEIAVVMDCPVGTVMSRLYRARRQLEECLAPEHASLVEPDGK